VSPRRSATDAANSRQTIIKRAVELASVEGLETISFAQLAEQVQMSKAGVSGHFKNKQELQLAALSEAIQMFRHAVLERAVHSKPGLTRLLARCDCWSDYLGSSTFPGGCFLTAAATEYDGRPGPIRDAIAAALRAWNTHLETEIQTAIDNQELKADSSPPQLAFELGALATGTNQARQLLDDSDAPMRCRTAMRNVILNHAWLQREVP
jgi:AcrR family transcriptional regulator